METRPAQVRHLRVMIDDVTRGRVRLDRIKRRLDLTGLSAWEASRRAGLSPDAIRDIERGKTKAPRISTIYAIAEILECDPAYLTGDQDKPRAAPADAAPAAQAGFALDYDEVELIGLYRMAKDAGEAERILTIARSLVTAAASRPVDQRGRKAS